MLPVVWLSPALDDLREIATYIAWENPSAARRLKSLLQEAIEPVAVISFWASARHSRAGGSPKLRPGLSCHPQAHRGRERNPRQAGIPLSLIGGVFAGIKRLLAERP
ncbi:Addiction module toxin, RelE/StbE family [Pseudomonas amygdali pv. aesculi]|nr:Addiction module toxin, RelE/StbE family [Pseudomonas amygdali pv. aesculi]